MEKTLNILAIDDNAENLKVLNTILRQEGYNIAIALDAINGMKILTEVSIDLILMDIMMPGIDGFEACKLIKANNSFSEIPIIFISAINSTQDIVKALNSGGVDYITKPFQAEEVKVRVATHLKLSQQKKELQKLNADKNKFISILAHDLRSPFSSLIGLTDLLYKNFRNYDSQKTEDFLDIILRSAKSTFGLLENILTWARAEQGKIPFEPVKLDLLKICEEISSYMQLVAISKNIKIIININQDINLTADKDMITTIIRNLISNGLKFTKSGGKITVSAKRKKGETIIMIADTGIGISEKVASTLFKMTEVLSTDGTADEKGTGIGLLICKEFVDKHGGSIWVESELNVGTTFSFSIPDKTE